MSPLVISRNQMNGRNLVESTKIERIAIPSKKKDKREDKSRKHSPKILRPKEVSDGSDQLEKSGLSEELGEPLNRVGYLSDESQNSKKRRRRDESPPAVESRIKASPVKGNPLRIRLILKPTKAPREDHPVVCSTADEEFLIHKESLSSVPGLKAAETEKRKKHKPSKEDRYNALFDDWIPPVKGSFIRDDDDCLFGNTTRAAKSVKNTTTTRLHRPDGSSWPRAQFLSDVGIHSLPYAVPF